MAKSLFPIKKSVTKKNSSGDTVPLFKGRSLSYKQLVTGLLFLSIVMLGVSSWFWWSSVLTNPDRVLSDMLGRSLQTDKITRSVTQQDTQSLLNQSVRLNLAPDPITQTITALSQKEENGVSVVVTETLGTKQEDFVRYRSIESSESGLNKENVKDVVNVWSKRGNQGEPPSFLTEATLGIVPFGNLNNADRKAVLDILRDKQVYTYTKATKKWQSGRHLLAYDMTVTPAGLVEALAVYSRLSGLGEQSQLDPKAYAEVQPINIKMTIDIMTRQLVSIEYVDSNRVEQYHSNGLRTTISTPDQSIAFDELQKRVQKLQN